MKFGVREICNVTFKALAEGQKLGDTSFRKYQPVFVIDTATASEMSQETTTVYAQGGRGYNRLIAWEGEKTMTFTVTDALMSPMGLAVLSGAGFKKDNAHTHMHVTVDVTTESDGKFSVQASKIANELGLTLGASDKLYVCADDVTPIYVSQIDGSGDIVAWGKAEDIEPTEKTGSVYELVGPNATLGGIAKSYNGSTDTTGAKIVSAAIRLDMYVLMETGAFEIDIKPGDFGGDFYVEADTLFRRRDTGKDMAATITFPHVKVQSAFTFSMAASGDPSTFDFTMDALPGYTRFDSSKMVNVVIDVVEGTGSTKVDSKHVANTDSTGHNQIAKSGSAG